MAPILFLPVHSKEKVGKEPPTDKFIMDNLKTSLATKVENDRGNTDGDIVWRFIKPRASTIIGQLVYAIYGPWPLIAISKARKEFFNSAFRIWIGEIVFKWLLQKNQDEKVWRDLGLRHNRVEHLSIIIHNVTEYKDSI